MLQSCYKTNYDETLDWVRAAGRGIALNRTSYHYNKTIWSYDGETDWQDLRHNREVGNWMGTFIFPLFFLVIIRKWGIFAHYYNITMKRLTTIVAALLVLLAPALGAKKAKKTVETDRQ